MSQTTVEFLEKLRHFIESEANTQYRQLERQWSTPLAERVAKGWAIEGVRVKDFKNNIVYLTCATNESRFREGDLIVLHRGNPRDQEIALHCDLQYDGETDLEASLIQGNEFLLEYYKTGWIIDQDWFDSRQFYRDALDQAADSQLGRSRVLPLLQGTLAPRVDPARYDRAVEALKESGLNESQVEAVAMSYAADLLHLIQGPPGTGKTLMLAHLAKLLVQDGRRVFVTALTHRAIHNALNKIARVDEVPVCKIGGGRHTEDLQADNFETFTESRFAEIDGGYVVGATPFALQTRRLENVEFDVVLFDEASQITLPLAIMGMLAGSKYIFIGDENQLPPVTVFSDPDEAPKSIFAFLAGRGNETMLDITYRLNEPLSAWPSRTFYRNELRCSPQAGARRLELSDDVTPWDFVLDPGAPAVFLDLCHANTTVRSRVEAETVVELVYSLLIRGVSPEEIGVVVPYRAQSRLVRSLARRIIENEEILRKLVIDTVERMQGQEREVVLVSFATASPKFAAQVADFLFQPQRLNVAVTRPRTKLILVGSHHLLDADQYDPGQSDAIKMLRDLFDGCLHLTVPYGRLNG